MGLISFIKDAGANLFGSGESEEEKDQNAAEEMAKTVDNLGFEIQNLDIAVDGDKATVSGKAPDQATREKVVLAVGNTKGIAHVDDLLTVEKQEPEARYHTVESGDTLSAIAKEYYGEANEYPAIFDANKPMLQDPDEIYPGQKLRIPKQ